jgi:hypothetical protein
MDARTGIWAAKKLLVSFSKNAPTSIGMRAFVDKFVPKLRERYPHLEIEVQEKNTRYPHLVGYDANGREKPIGVKKLEAPEIMNYAELLIEQWGGMNVNHNGKRVKTKTQSVTGLWTPFTNR